MKEETRTIPNRPCTAEAVYGEPDEGPPAMVATSPPDRDDLLCEQLGIYLDCRSRNVDPPAPLAEAWDRFYLSHTPRIRAFLRKSALPESDREDCLQCVWIEVVAHLAALPYDRSRGRLSTWLLTVARNRSVDMLRRRRRLFTGLVEALDALVDPCPGPIAAYECHSTRARVKCVLAELSAEASKLNYQVFHQRMIDNRPCAEVAAKLGLTPEQVRFRLHRMKRKFRDLFDRSIATHHIMDESIQA
jgi:RNA polymerase sigma factor (sigma-70 family)